MRRAAPDPPLASEPSPPSAGLGRTALWGGFVVTGAATVLLGPLIPALRPTWGVDAATSAVLFPALFIATSVGAVVSSWNLRLSLIGGYLAIAIGLGAVGVVPWPLPVVALVAVGLGVGLINPATNLLVAHDPASVGTDGQRGATLARLNLVWGIGAVSCPLLFAAARESVPILAVLAVPAVAAVVVALGLWTDRTIGDFSEPETVDEEASSGWQRHLLLLPIALIFCFYVGIETSVGGWLVELADQIGGVGVVSMLIGSGYWAALLLGRALMPAMLRHVSEPGLFVAGLVIALVGVTLLWTADSRTAAALGGALAGFGLSPVFPLTVSLLAEQTATTGARGTGWVFSLTGVGGAAMPWLTARMPGAADSLRAGFIVPWLSVLVLVALLAIQRRVTQGEVERIGP
ncbi:MAG: hypothetical protein AAGC60_19925 [Acidobacteriota bacterium]